MSALPLGPARPVPTPPGTAAFMLRQRFLTSRPEHALERHLSIAGVMAVLALCWSLAVLAVLPGLSRDAASSLRWTELVASGVIALALGFAVARAVGSGLFAGLPGWTALLVLFALGYLAAYAAQLYMYFTDDGRWAEDWALHAKLALAVPFAVVIFRFADTSRPSLAG
jgi:hypothetical protein